MAGQGHSPGEREWLTLARFAGLYAAATLALFLLSILLDVVMRWTA